MKKVLYNLLIAQPSKEAKYHGGGEYIKTVFEFLVSKHHGFDMEISVAYSETRFIDEWIRKIILEKKIQTFCVESTQEIENVLFSNHFDVFYCGMIGDFSTIKYPQNLKKICTLHDLRDYERNTDVFAYKYESRIIKKIKCIAKFALTKKIRKKKLNEYRKEISVFDKVICITKHTKYTFLSSLINTEINDIPILYTPSKHYSGEKKPNGFEKNNYILMVSGNRWIKNCYRAIVAIEKLYENGLLESPTVITGNIPRNIHKMICDNGNFVLLDYVEPDELEYLYHHCAIFLYPTLNEGFGMPPLEAMKYGKTCIVSGICSLPELYSGASYFVNPESTIEIGARIIQAVHEKISAEIILDRYTQITNKQLEDLEGLARVLLDV